MGWFDRKPNRSPHVNRSQHVRGSPSQKQNGNLQWNLSCALPSVAPFLACFLGFACAIFFQGALLKVGLNGSHKDTPTILGPLIAYPL